VDVLRYPRLGSRVRHLLKVLPVKPATDETAPKPKEKKMPKITRAKRHIIALLRSIKRRLRR
jgi:hypothetical protein